MHLFKRIILVTMISGAAGCSQNEPQNTTSVSQPPSSQVSQAEIDAYLEFKGVPEDDKERAERIRDDFLERKALASAILDSEYIDRDLVDAEVEEFRLQMLMSRYFENYLNDVANEQAVQNYYNSHPAEFQVKKTAVAHILLRTRAGMSEAERRVKMTTAQEAYSKAKAGEPFEELAQQYSEDKISAKKGGDLGWIKEGAIDPTFSQKAFSLQVGEVSEPFVTPFGYHIVKNTEEQQVITVPFDAVKGDIRFKLRQLAKDEEMQRLRSTLDKPE